MTDTTDYTDEAHFTCNQCGEAALIWAPDGRSVKCDECGAFSSMDD